MRKLSTISFAINSKEAEFEYSKENHEWIISLPKSIEPGDKATLTAKILLFQIADPLPREITQDEIQCSRLNGNLHFPSQYQTNSEDFYIRVHTDRYIAATQALTFDQEAELFSAHFNSAPSDKEEQFFVHYTCPTSYLTAIGYTRQIIVNQLAPSRIQEHYDVKNTGASFKGELNAFKNMVRKNDQAGTINHLILDVPPTAQEFSYRDGIGNISSSSVYTSPVVTRLNLQPRFPIYGGWHTTFYVEYYLPWSTLSDENAVLGVKKGELPASQKESRAHKGGFFYSDDSDEMKEGQMLTKREHSFAVPLAPSLENGASEDVVLKIALPEGAKSVVVRADACKLEMRPDEVTYHNLDYLGRRTLVLHRRNVLNSPAFGNIVVEFNLPFIYSIHKPIIFILIVVSVVLALTLIRGFINWFKKGNIQRPLPVDSKIKAREDKKKSE
ncbi:putative dolichyl-diphosphooligosaccharide-protein glycosyltransferase subunit 1 precursor [Monocercomonoides exilis]|uniref:putative dolichyl-diphosphooligosaccharide-protein glycosyltransferase subunit 1 precursor n=1 Tax=Monocercomonoides exilis TaxID=2049356 RepID=UPI00355AC93F|nr:putative dolichyl-diphosphooligosaccharide-protein glycosyltransferase subunit 1 precursor [Monocercomonoides exilis]|eukprot:MONOS_6704.1-p1 / transcript=MONOS_6704.1 / gene=MONOS_6704 / organism=Monocercomonoides_exilis_PA203 / gene_product=dolichyl-diphosphooligosaccharide-protein glycosyltransferase subunit 1 precursor / transcript_product=dolichyl-diphosphooligosaccharide-protein glycosyltransferase subunit 1 precursor / location=Mono_scaffold00216:25234-26744(+) / protein_length=443 / sequence_SO=supercontig / SO=protein_coding / is_pseudo=false